MTSSACCTKLMNIPNTSVVFFWMFFPARVLDKYFTRNLLYLNADWFWGFQTTKELVYKKYFVKTFTLFKYRLSGSLKRFKSTHSPPF